MQWKLASVSYGKIIVVLCCVALFCFDLFYAAKATRILLFLLVIYATRIADWRFVVDWLLEPNVSKLFFEEGNWNFEKYGINDELVISYFSTQSYCVGSSFLGNFFNKINSEWTFKLIKGVLVSSSENMI